MDIIRHSSLKSQCAHMLPGLAWWGRVCPKSLFPKMSYIKSSLRTKKAFSSLSCFVSYFFTQLKAFLFKCSIKT